MHRILVWRFLGWLRCMPLRMAGDKSFISPLEKIS